MKKPRRVRCWAPLIAGCAFTFGLARAQDTGPCLNTQPCSEAVQGEQSADVPAEPGLYTVTDKGVMRIEGEVVAFQRTGSRLVSGLTVGIKAAKINVQLPGRHSQNIVGESPVFYYRMSPEMIQQGAGSGDLVLLRMEVKGDRRQVETGAAGLWRSSKGVSIKKQIATEVHEQQPRLFRVRPVGGLNGGEYGFYLFRGNVLPPYFYDFSVPGGK